MKGRRFPIFRLPRAGKGAPPVTLLGKIRIFNHQSLFASVLLTPYIPSPTRSSTFYVSTTTSIKHRDSSTLEPQSSSANVPRLIAHTTTRWVDPGFWPDVTPVTTKFLLGVCADREHRNGLTPETLGETWRCSDRYACELGNRNPRLY